jgi:hypothetical protein
MNTYHNFNPDEKRMALAALLQDPTQVPQDTFKMPGTPASGMGMGLMDMAKMMKKKDLFSQAPAPVFEGQTSPVGNADYLNSGYSPG